MNNILSKFLRSKRIRDLKHRGLRMELLEGRRLMAADLPLHNRLIAEDVNKDFNVTPLDAMLVINALNRNSTRAGEGEVGPATHFTDVSGDGVISPLDAMLVINALNAEGEGSKLVSYTLQTTDTNGNEITSGSVTVGTVFVVKVFGQDLRPTGDRPQNPTGIGAAGFDLDIVGSEMETNLLTFAPFNNTLVPAGGLFGGVNSGDVGSDQEYDEFSVLFFDVPANPSLPQQVFNGRFTALKSGEVSFGLNAADTPAGETILAGDSAAIPTPLIMYAGFTKLVIQADPTAPVAVNDTVSSPEDTALILAGTGSTVSPPLIQNDKVTAGRTLTVTAVNAIPGVTQGSISGLTYTPPANFAGQDRVTYTIRDTNGLTSSATVTINVTQVNDAPIAGNDLASGIENEPVTIAITTLLANDSPGPGESTQVLTITGVTASTGSVAIAGPNVVFTPPTDFVGDLSFNYTVADNGSPSLTAVGRVTVTFEPGVRPLARRDTAPPTTEISAGQPQTGVVIDVLANDAVNVGATPVLITFDTTSAWGGTITANPNGSLVYVPAFEFNGLDTFTYTMNDSSATGADSRTTVTVNVVDVNDAPLAADDNATGTEDIAVTIAISTLLANDSPGLGETAADTPTPQTLTLSIPNGSSTSGTAVVSGSNVIFTPNADLNGKVTFTYLVTDSGTPALSATATVTVDLAAVNDAPVAGADNVSTNEDVPLAIPVATLLSNDLPGPATATDEAGQVPLVLTAVSKPASTLGTVSLSGGNVIYTPALNFNGTETFFYTLQDSLGASSTGTVTVTVNPINDAPVAGVDNVVAFKGVALQISVAELLANDTAGPANESGQTPLRITSVFGAVNGTVSLNSATGIITFTPIANYSGPASFQYTLQDSGPTGGDNVNSSTGTVNVTVRDFVPTNITGTVWVDETNDGVMDTAERKLGGVDVTLTGNALGVPIAARTYITLADGSYHFNDLAPGQYVVSYSRPHYMVDGRDVPGDLGDADSLANQFTVNIAQPGGARAGGYNFAVTGIESAYGRTLEQLASRYFLNNPNMVYKGLYAAIGADNSSLWLSKLDGFDGVVTGEVVLNSTGTRLQVTIVDANHKVYTASLSSGQFVVTTDRLTGNKLIRVLGDAASIDFQEISLASPPPITINRYLESIDEIFDQEGWDDVL